MPVFNKDGARYSSFQEFLSFTKKKDNAPSFTNLFSVSLNTPAMLDNTELRLSDDIRILTDYYADSVNLPSKQMTTGQALVVGSGFKYATNAAYSQMQINFRMPRDQHTRNLFETWTSMMSNDADQYTKFYDDYVCKDMYIYKWERGGGDQVYTDPKLLRSLREAGNDFLLARKFECTACWYIQNVFPYNIGSIRLDNANAKTMTMSVSFYFERYRFFSKNQREFPVPGATGGADDRVDNRFS